MCDGKRATTEAESGRSPLASPFILHPSSFPRSAFTLVELLVVIVIIGILMGLITGAAATARSAARRAGIGVEIANLDMALKKYRDQFGEYPPDCTDLTTYTTVSTNVGAVFMRHLARAFPRFVLPSAAGSTPNNQFLWLNAQFYYVSGFYLSNLDASSAMVFFLAGWPANQAYATNFANQQLVYFSSDPTDPLDIYASNYGKAPGNIPTSRMQPLFQFDTTRLQQSIPGVASWWQFFPNIGSNSGTTGNCPYVYFRATANGRDPHSGAYPVPGYFATSSTAPWGAPYVFQRWPSNAAVGSAGSITSDIVYPYYEFNIAQQLFQYYMPKDYQIICAGLDNHFGYRYNVPLDSAAWSLNSPSSNGNNELQYGFDNQTNFSTPTIEKTQ
jgi:prepilin-type N-terminal cleavage/methylation domain-containing protein